MSDGYNLSRRQARVCRWAGLLFLLAALFKLVDVGATGMWAGSHVQCRPGGCAMIADRVALLPEEERTAVVATTATRAAFDRYFERPIVRLGLAGIAALTGLPLAILLASVGLALRRLAARTGDDLGRALPWLRRAALAALLLALLEPLNESLIAMLLYPGTPAGPYWYLAVDFMVLARGLLLAAAAFAAVWALAAGHRAEQDATGFV